MSVEDIGDKRVCRNSDKRKFEDLTRALYLGVWAEYGMVWFVFDAIVTSQPKKYCTEQLRDFLHEGVCGSFDRSLAQAHFSVKKGSDGSVAFDIWCEGFLLGSVDTKVGKM